MYSKLYNENSKYGKTKVLKAALSGTFDEITFNDDTLDIFFETFAIKNNKNDTAKLSKTLTAKNSSCPYRTYKGLL